MITQTSFKRVKKLHSSYKDEIALKLKHHNECGNFLKFFLDSRNNKLTEMNHFVFHSDFFSKPTYPFMFSDFPLNLNKYISLIGYN